MNQHQVQQSQLNRINGFGATGNGLLQMNGNNNSGKMPKNSRQLMGRQIQPQPLSGSQLANIQHLQQQDTLPSLGLARSKTAQQATEAQYARAKLSAKKCFNIEDDLEFYPNPIDMRSKQQQQQAQAQAQVQQAQQAHLLNSRMVMNSPISPYSTPTKPVQFSNPNQQVHRMQGFMSPVQNMSSPSHQHHQQQQQQQQQRNIINHSQIFNSPQPVPNVRRDLSNNSPMSYQNSSTSRHW